MSNVFRCEWSIKVNGTSLDLDRLKCVESIDILEQCNGSDTCTIKVADPNFVFLSDNIFLEESKIYVELGWFGDTQRVKFNGYISAIDIDFPEVGYPELSIFCIDESYKMDRKKKKRSWDKVTRPDVVKKIAKEYGYKCVVQTGYTFDKEDTISQSDETDIAFCEKLAGEEREPFMCKLIGDTLYYVKMGLLKDPYATLYYKKYPYDVISFSPRINKGTIKVEETSADVVTSNKTVSSSKANNSNTGRDVQGSSVTSESLKDQVYNTRTGKWEEAK